MKKFISGVVVGIFLFASASVFADSVGIIGKKVTGIYIIMKDGEKVAEAGIINGSAYVPVRAVSDAVGVSLSVEGKNIVIESKSTASVASSDEIAIRVNGLNVKLNLLLNDIKAAEGGVRLYEDSYLPSAQQKYDTAKGTQYEQQAKEYLAARTKEYEQRKTDLMELQKQLTELELELVELRQ